MQPARGRQPEAPPVTGDEHLVLYQDAAGEQEHVMERLRPTGVREVTPHDPWWRKSGDVSRDPDGWEVVLVRAPE